VEGDEAMLIIFFDIKITFHFEFIPQGQTVNQACYVEILKRLCEAVHRKMPELRPNDWILHRDNTPGHKAPSVKHFVDQKRVLKCNTHPVPLTWLRMSCGCFQK
jgi:hypothetical protein